MQRKKVTMAENEKSFEEMTFEITEKLHELREGIIEQRAQVFAMQVEVAEINAAIDNRELREDD
jgi:hypothetical protein